MRYFKTAYGNEKLWLSASDTEAWATRPHASWPCSSISGHRLFAEFAPNGDLVDLALDSRSADVPCDELNAMTSDFLVAVRKASS
jgi:hypothetical protein